MIDVTGVTGVAEVNRDIPGFGIGDRVQFGKRPEYGDRVRVHAVKRDGKPLYNDLKVVAFIDRADLCPLDCGHIKPGETLTCN